MTQDIPRGMFWFWVWGDEEIENPKSLKCQLLSIQQAGYSAVLAVLGNTRYEIVDSKVTRAVSQASQWAAKRGILFWFQADPRKASRFLISKTGEKTQNLFMLKDLNGGFHASNLCLGKIVDGRFEIHCSYMHGRLVPECEEGTLSFEPSGLERAFSFKMKDGVVLNRTIRDVSGETRFHVNLREGRVEVFGSFSPPDDEEWWAMAFPRFDTNLTDFAGQESNDALYGLIEDLFDAGAYLNGVTWDRGGYCGESGRLPVSLSIYNIFIFEYGYDLRDRLVALALPVDNGSHASVRHDYYSMLTEVMSDAFREFQQNVHGFFGGVETGIFHEWECGKSVFPATHREFADPWIRLASSTSGMAVLFLRKEDLVGTSIDAIAHLALIKSMGAFSKTESALVRIQAPLWDEQTIEYCSGVTALYSVRWMADASPETGAAAKPDYGLFSKANETAKRVEGITGFRFPESDTLLAYPYETWIAADPGIRMNLSERLHRFIGMLILNGIQLDVISSSFLRLGKPSVDGFRIGHRSYRALICPYPEILRQDAADFLALLKKRGLPALIGGSAPRMTPAGKALLFSSPQDFDPDSADLSWLDRAGIRPLLQSPPGALGSLIRNSGETFFLFCPSAPGKTFEGEARYGEVAFPIPRSSKLVIFKLSAGRSVERVL
jgi:hypothetical protein